jgi:flagellar biosynthesis/type III secretory pathway chaperone
MTVNSDNLIEALRNEMQEYGGLLSLFNDQQTAILERKPDLVMAAQEAITQQVDTIHACRKLREESARVVAKAAGQNPDSTVRALVESCAEAVRPLLHALLDEVNRLILKTRRRAQQNQMLLARSIEVSQQILQRINPEMVTKTYSRRGRVQLGRGAAASRCLARS